MTFLELGTNGERTFAFNSQGFQILLFTLGILWQGLDYQILVLYLDQVKSISEVVKPLMYVNAESHASSDTIYITRFEIHKTKILVLKFEFQSFEKPITLEIVFRCHYHFIITQSLLQLP